jgi:pilus assembly protein CpaB
MKWSIVGLLLLGVIAAAAAAFLVAGILSSRAAEASSAAVPEPEARIAEAEVLVAARDLKPMTLLGAGDLEVQRIARSLRPPASYSSPLQIIGKLLIVPVMEGQVLTDALFADEGSGHHLAAAIGHGKRAVSVNLSDTMGLEGLLYPGCSVDVVASMYLPSDGGLGKQPVAMTLLEAVTVLAVGERTIVASERPANAAGRPGSSGRPSVTLLVTPEQAEALKLATGEGSVSLVMRNPTENGSQARDATRLPALSPTFAEFERLILERDRAERERQETLAKFQLERAEWDNERARLGIERERGSTVLDHPKQELERAELLRKLTDASERKVLVVRGRRAESQTFPRIQQQP